jgi:hypothetical protein
MIDSELISFFKGVNTITSFERRRKIYELTNNLDIDLLFDLKREYHLYYSYKIYEIKKGNNLNVKDDDLKSRIDSNADLNKNIDAFLRDNEYSKIQDVVDETAEFMEDLNELIKRKIKSTSSKPRIKTDVLYKMFIENEFMEVDYHHDEDFNDEIFGVERVGVGQSQEELIDLSNTSITGKIIYLEKLGVIDYLRSQQPFSTSVMSMATVLSAVTGANPTTIQPLLNPLLSKDVVNKNNPLNSVKTVNIIENKLLSIGFKCKVK